MIKILGGEFRTRRLQEPRLDEASRPYIARIKESVFNLLRGWFDDASVLDLFAGVGTVGLEAVSRGATRVVMVERSRDTFKKLEENIAMLGCGDRATAVHGDALASTALLRAHDPVDIVFMDPPYPMMTDDETRLRILEQAARCAPIMNRPSFLVLRTPCNPDDIDHSIEGFIGPEVHDYGKDKYVLLYQPVEEENTTD